jgi:cysteine desulfurase
VSVGASLLLSVEKIAFSVRDFQRLNGSASKALGFLQFGLFDVHVFEFTGLKDLAALHAFYELGVFFAGNDLDARVLALAHIDLLGRLRRTGWTHRFRSLWRAPGIALLGGSSPELAVFLAVRVELSSRKMDTSPMNTEAAPRALEECGSVPVNPGKKLPIYLDNHATTPLDPQVLAAMLPYLQGKFGNPASRSHVYGWEASKAVDVARAQVATLIGAEPDEIIFTSGATESDNLAIKGVGEARRDQGRHVLTVVTEHKAVLDSCKHLECCGFEVTFLPVGRDGLIDLDRFRDSLRADTILVTIMVANNETGVLQPIAEIGAICRERGILFHTDAAQAAGKVPLDVRKQKIDLLSISAHKLYGPKGVGALYVRKSPEVRLAPQIHGGGHEQGLRSGTLNTPGIVGLGKACELAEQGLQEESCRIEGLRNRLRDRIMSGLDGVSINGSSERRLPGNLNVSFAGIPGEDLLTAMDDIAVSSGAACTSDHIEASYVLKALGLSDELAQSSVRFGLGRFTTQAEVDYASRRVVETVRQLREF